MVVNPAVAAFDTLGDQHLQLDLDRVAELALEKVLGVGLLPLSDSGHRLRGPQQPTEVLDHPRDDSSGFFSLSCFEIALSWGGKPEPFELVGFSFFEKVEVGLGQMQRPLPKCVVAAPPEFVDNRAATNFDLGKADGVVPELVDQIGFADDARQITDDSASQTGEAGAKPAVDKLQKLGVEIIDFRLEVFRSQKGLYRKVAETRYQVAQQMERLVTVAGLVHLFEE